MGDASTITAAAQATGGAAGAYGTYRAGEFNSKVDRFNAKVATMQAADAIRRGGEAVDRHRTQVKVLKGAQRAALAAQGVVVDDGSAADVIADTSTQAAIDERTIRTNAALEAWGYQVQAVDHRARANVEMATARNDAAGGLMTTVARFNDTAYRAGWFEPKASAAPSTPKAAPKAASTYNPALPIY